MNKIRIPSATSCVTEKNLMNENEIDDNSIICQIPPSKGGNVIIKLKLSLTIFK